MVEARLHDAVYGVALTVRNSHQINRICRHLVPFYLDNFRMA
jgi:hypothetical protein